MNCETGIRFPSLRPSFTSKRATLANIRDSINRFKDVHRDEMPSIAKCTNGWFHQEPSIELWTRSTTTTTTSWQFGRDNSKSLESIASVGKQRRRNQSTWSSVADMQIRRRRRRRRLSCHRLLQVAKFQVRVPLVGHGDGRDLWTAHFTKARHF